jgi:hypothetical protein
MRLYRQALTLTRNWTVDRRLFRMRKLALLFECACVRCCL